jgi:hypothetical protein
MSESGSPCIYCPACGAEHPWLVYLKGQEFECACGHVLNMPKEMPTSSSVGTKSGGSHDSATFSLDALVNQGRSASGDDLDDSDELEVIEDADDLEVIEEDEPAVLPVGDEDGDYELAADPAPMSRMVLPSSAPIPAARPPVIGTDILAGITPSAPASAPPGMTLCNYCHKPYPFRETSCPHCGCDELGRQVKKDDRKQEKAALHVMGIACTPRNIAIVATLFLAMMYLGYWFFTGPAAKFRYYDMQVVQGSVLMQVGIAERGGIKGMLGMSGGDGATKAGSATLNDDAGTLKAGGHNDLYAVHPDATGQYILLDMAIQQSVLEQNNSRSGYDMMLVSNDYKLKSGSTVVQGTLLMEQLPNTLTLSLNESNNLHGVIPKGIVPEKLSWEGDFNRIPIRGDTTFTGTQGAIGKLDFYIFSMEKDAMGAKGMSVTGNLQYTSPQGIKAVFTYNGYDMNLDVDAKCQVWRSIKDEKVKASWSPWHQYHFRVIFPKPPAGQYELTFMDKRAMRLNVP